MNRARINLGCGSLTPSIPLSASGIVCCVGGVLRGEGEETGCSHVPGSAAACWGFVKSAGSCPRPFPRPVVDDLHQAFYSPSIACLIQLSIF